MDIAPTQEIESMAEANDSFSSSSWGQLLPLRANLQSFDLTKEETKFGRGEDCDLTFQPNSFDSTIFAALSKCHFVIYREISKTGYVTFLKDLSSNGTFINGRKVGKTKTSPLNNNDKIALAQKTCACFAFIDNALNNNNRYPKELTERYTITLPLGSGACGEVKLAYKKETCERFAIKIVQKKKFSLPAKNLMADRVMSEVEIMQRLQHPCIIKIFDVIDTDDVLYMVMEYVEGGELFDRVEKEGQFSEEMSKFFFLQMVYSIKYLHDNGITHRDLKPENILLASNDKETLIKIADFGLSKLVDERTMLKTFCGTPNYLAPEILKSQGSATYTCAIDVWSLGVILFICLSGYPPFTEERKDMNMRNQILQGCYDFPESYWGGVSADAIDLIKRMLTVNPEERITLAQALDHPWLADPVVKEKLCNHLRQSDVRDNEGLMMLQRLSSNGSSSTVSLITTDREMSCSGDDDCSPKKRRLC